MRFVTKVWHPNVSSANGAICLDILKDQWSPALTLKTALLSLQALLSSPEPADPQVWYIDCQESATSASSHFWQGYYYLQHRIKSFSWCLHSCLCSST